MCSNIVSFSAEKDMIYILEINIFWFRYFKQPFGKISVQDQEEVLLLCSKFQGHILNNLVLRIFKCLGLSIFINCI